MTRRPPEIIRFGSTDADEEDVLRYGYMPARKQIRGNAAHKEKVLEACSLAARLRFPDGEVDIVVDADEMTEGSAFSHPGDALRIRMGEALSPNLNYYSAESLADMRDFLMVFFDIAIETATHREKQCDTLGTERKGAVPVELRQTPTITYNDYLDARVKSNKKSKRGRRKTSGVTHYRADRDQHEAAMQAIAEQGTDNDEDTGSGND